MVRGIRRGCRNGREDARRWEGIEVELDLPVGVETAEAGGVVDGCGWEAAEEVGDVSGRRTCIDCEVIGRDRARLKMRVKRRAMGSCRKLNG